MVFHIKKYCPLFLCPERNTDSSMRMKKNEIVQIDVLSDFSDEEIKTTANELSKDVFFLKLKKLIAVSMG